MKYTKKIIGLLVVLVLAFLFFNKGSNADGEYNTFTQCLKDSGTKFYGSYQCVHCTSQKQMFGASAEYLPYIECGPLGGPQSLTCQQAGITGYPTWEFPDGSRQPGVLSFAVLAERSGCELVKDTIEE